MQLTPGVTINVGDTVTRQTIFDVLANAIGGTVNASDLTPEVQLVTSQTDMPSPYPGKLWYDHADQLLKVYVDVLDGTAISLWLAIGPDRFDVPVIATEPIPFGAALQLAGTGPRRVKLPPDPVSLAAMSYAASIWEPWKVIGFNQGGRAAASDRSTAESGSWLAAAVDGIVNAWHPVNRLSGGVWASSSGGIENFDTLISQVTQITCPSSISELRGGLVKGDYGANQANTHVGIALGLQGANVKWTAWTKVIFFGARTGRI